MKLQQKWWMRIASVLPEIPGKYDVVIGYQDLFPGYYSVSVGSRTPSFARTTVR
jgi:hypothetical protein